MIDIERVETLALFAQAERAKWEDAGKPWPQPNVSMIDMIMALSPLVVLELIAELKSLRSQVAALQARTDSWQSGYDQGRTFGTKTALSDRSQLKAENEDYKAGQERYESLIEDLKGRISAAPALNCFDEIARLKAENEALRKNDARYRWLRSERNLPGCLSSDPEKAKWLDEYLMCGDNLDAAIDAVMRKEPAQ